MKLVISFLFFVCSSLACELNSQNDYVTLSAPMSTLMKKLRVLSRVRLISTFHPYEEKIKKVSGGIFLRGDKINLKENTILFFDESKELERNLKKTIAQKVIVKTRGLSSIQSTRYLINKLSPYLKNCKKRIDLLQLEIEKMKERISSFKFKDTFLFYLGGISKDLKNNSMLITHDGFLLDLKENKSFKTYPSTTAYTNWSAKILKELKNKKYYGLKKSSKKKIHKLKSKYFNINYPGILIPGYSQVEFLNFFLDSL